MTVRSPLIIAILGIIALGAVLWRGVPELRVALQKKQASVPGDSEVRPVTNTIAFKADFNDDGLLDIAVGETDALGRDRVSIYLQRATGDGQVRHYKIGHLQGMATFAPTAIMSTEANGKADLFIIFSYGNAEREIVHYRSEGEEFVEIDRDRL